MKRKLVAGYVISLHFLLAVLISNSDFVDRFKTKFGLHESGFSEHYYQMTSFHLSMEQNIPSNSILFFGDSITQGLAVTAVSPLAANYGIGGDTSSGLLNRLPLYESVQNARLIVISIGHNDLYDSGRHEILNNVFDILTFLPEKTDVILTAIFPIDESIVEGIRNRDIYLINQQLASLAGEIENVTMINISEKLAPQGHLLPAYHVGDGIHLSTQGYNIWIDELRSTMGLNTMLDTTNGQN